MKTKISIFITTIALLFGVTAAFAQGTQAYFKKNGATVFQSPISDIDSIVFKQVTNEDVCQSFDDPQGVVINGVRWATRNVDAPGTFASSPCDYGEYYQFNKGTTDFLFWYDYDSSVYANSDSWLPANDPSPSGWRVPNYEEIQKLLDSYYVTYEWVNNNGLTGGKFTDKTTGNSIFLPAAGYRVYNVGTLYDVGYCSDYWSSTAYVSGSAYNLHFDNSNIYWTWYSHHNNGLSIRPVADVEKEMKVTFIYISPYVDVSIEVGKTTTLSATVTPAYATNTNIVWSSLNPDIAIVDEQTGTVTGVSVGMATIRATAADGSGVTADKSVVVLQPSSDDINGVVINGVRWATRNVDAPGAFVQTPEDYGEYYQFNKGTMDFLSFTDYYNSVYANSDSWLPANDPSPSGWRVPTPDEIQKLFNTIYVTYEWIDKNGLTGGKFTDRATGNSIFLPAAGFRDQLLYDVGVNGSYWSSGVDATSIANAYDLSFLNGIAYWKSIANRSKGFSVRPVAK